jgi:hypothetical protein
LELGSEVDQDVAEEYHVEELVAEIEGLFDEVEASVLDAPAKLWRELELVTATHEMTLERRSRHAFDGASAVDPFAGIGQGGLIDVGRENTPPPASHRRMIGEHDGEGRRLLPARAARTPDPQLAVRTPVRDFVEESVGERLELCVSAK